MLRYESPYLNSMQPWEVDPTIPAGCDDFAKSASFTFRWASGASVTPGTNLTLTACGGLDSFTPTAFPVLSVRSTSNPAAGAWSCVT